ncbi:MAG TPA: NADH-quinone oxidoreductase subunit J [Phycisphaerales bacterium]|nr:NADH-quinone oxidoreductase subunit J [Phycisphaerales bacterium]
MIVDGRAVRPHRWKQRNHRSTLSPRRTACLYDSPGRLRSSIDRPLGIHVGQIIHPFIFFGLLVLGGLGVCLALPRRGTTPQVVGALIAGIVGGLLMLFLGVKAGTGNLPNIYFYVFSAVGLGGALRVITHPRPVYAALYFILTVLASAGLFLLLSAEFMAFALVIVYAGAILITYLFVIMLATQAPEEGQEEVLAEYDTAAREPIAATVVGFVLLGALTVMMFRGLGSGEGMKSAMHVTQPDALLADVPRKVENVLRNNGILKEGEAVVAIGRAEGTILIQGADGVERTIPRNEWPENLPITNAELLGFNLLRDHPGTIEIAGVILLMAMLGAVVLSRKQVQLDDEAKATHLTALAKGVVSRDPIMDSPLELVNPVGAGPADKSLQGTGAEGGQA